MKNFKDYEPFSQMNQHPGVSPEYLSQVKGMMEQFQQVFDNDFWSQLSGFTNQKNVNPSIPIEIWEGPDHLFLSIVAPWLKDTTDVRIDFHNNESIRLKAKARTVKPPGAVETLIYSELPRRKVEKEIRLPFSVNDQQYAMNLENGILMITFEKIEVDSKRVNIPFDF